MSKNMRQYALRLFSLSALSTLPLVALSCANSQVQDVSVIKAALPTTWWISKTGANAIPEYQELFQQTLQEIKNANARFQNLPNFTLEISNAGNDDVNSLDRLNAGLSDLAIVNASLVSKDSYRNNPNFAKAYFQTETQAFFNDQEFKYFDEQNKTYFAKMQNEINDFLKAAPFKNWTNESQKWDGAKYLSLYNEEKTVRWYRGMIMIAGTLEERNAIQKAWDDKDWNAFKSFGILTKKPSSQGGFLLQNVLLKKHFGEEADLGNLLGDPKIKTGADPRSLGDDPHFKIAFDAANSFAWNPQDGEKYIPLDSEKSVTILTYTDPYLYDLGVFSNRFSELEKELILLTLQKISQDKKDTFGITSGYNAYRKINDLKRDVYEPYDAIFKS